MTRNLAFSFMLIIAAVLFACSNQDSIIAGDQAGNPAYSDDVMVDQIEVYTDSSACVRLLDKRVICSEYPASLGTRSLLRLTPSVACEENGIDCSESLVDEELDLMPALGGGANTLAGVTPLGCAKPNRGNGLICWGGESTRSPDDLSYFGDECLNGACNVICGEWQGQSGCWGHWILQEHDVVKFDGVCALLNDGDIFCPAIFGFDSGLDDLAKGLTTSYGAAIDVKVLPENSICIIAETGKVHCAGEMGEELAAQFSASESYNELIGNPFSSALCARRDSDGKIECVGVHPFLSLDELSACQNMPHTCPAGKSDESLDRVSLGVTAICGLNVTGRAVCYFQPGLSVDADDDPFGYKDRLTDENELLRELTLCESSKCTSAEIYSAISLNPGITHPSNYSPVLVGCGVTAKSRPHCFGMYTSGSPSCSWWDDEGCGGRVF